MADTPAKYCAIPSSEDQARVGGDEPYSTESFPAEARTKWTYFLLGCATLLPWSGDGFAELPISFVLISTQLCLMRRRFSCPDWQVPPSIRPSARAGQAPTH